MICIPMAGNSLRFYNAGYSKPKFQLEVENVSLFRLSLMSFIDYFDTETFLFILNKKNDSLAFVQNELKTLQIREYTIVQLENDTRGQADTVAIALSNESIDKNEHLLIFNIDTIRPKFQYPNHFPNFPWLETFIAEGEHWSFVEPVPNSDEVLRVVEKHRISKFCSTGIYFFPKIQDYLEVFCQFEATSLSVELYVAPLYQLLIDQNRVVKYSVITSNEIFLAGTPLEFCSLDANFLFETLRL